MERCQLQISNPRRSEFAPPLSPRANTLRFVSDKRRRVCFSLSGTSRDAVGGKEGEVRVGVQVQHQFVNNDVDL